MGVSPKKPISLLAIAIALSLLLHFAWLSYPFLKSLQPDPDFAQNQPAEIEVVPLNEKNKQIVQAEKLNNNEIDPDAKYLSEKNQKAEKQTKAFLNNKFQEGRAMGDGKAEKAQESKSAKNETVSPVEESITKKKNWKNLSLKDLSVPSPTPGATDDYLKEVPDANRTVLSTREYRFFSYYARIKDTLRQFWRPNVERKLAVLWSSGAKIPENEMITQLLVLLDEKGSITKISRVGSCGFYDIDEAAIDAFHKAGPFPNPPKGMIDQDGLVRIRWDFILKAETGPQISFRPPGRPIP